jgi:RHS repeat-associated protein
VLSNEYNARGNLEKVTVPGVGDYLYEYDANDKLIESQEPGGFTLEHTYSEAVPGLRTSYKESLGQSSFNTLFTYDTLHRLTGLQGPSGGTVAFGYGDLGGISRLNLGVTEMHYGYDALGRVTSQTLLSPVQRKNIDTTYYPDGKVRAYTQDYATHAYTYDFAGRLVGWDNGLNTVAYQYDRSGNLLNPGGGSPRFTFNGANEIESFDYDDAGNLLEDDKYIYAWDGEGRLVSVTDPADPQNPLATYTYHPDGLRKSKTTGGVTYNYHYDGSNLIRVTDGNDKTVWAITWSGASPVMLANAVGETFYYVTNYRGDVVNILDEDGYPVASYRYDPWGKPEYAEEEASVAGQPIRYASYVYDSETGLYYLQARYYDPVTGRFISQDPVWGEMGSPLSQNLHGYCGGDPINFIDPSGMKPLGWRRISTSHSGSISWYHWSSPQGNFTIKQFWWGLEIDLTNPLIQNLDKINRWNWAYGLASLIVGLINMPIGVVMGVTSITFGMHWHRVLSANDKGGKKGVIISYRAYLGQLSFIFLGVRPK